MEKRPSLVSRFVSAGTSNTTRAAGPPIAEIGVNEIKAVVKPFWDRNEPVAARALLSRIEAVLDYAFAHEWRPEGDNPAAWKRFKHLFPTQPNGRQHHKAVTWAKMPALYAKLAEIDSMSALALRLIILTGCRSNEIRGLMWGEVDFEAKTITIPASRMKRSIEFPAPLSSQALGLLKGLYRDQTSGELVFPSQSGKPVSNQSLWSIIGEASDNEATTHGTRASLRSWMGDMGVEFEVAEAMLAHAPGDAAVQAYHRTTMTERRRPVLQHPR
jgi:integrase